MCASKFIYSKLRYALAHEGRVVLDGNICGNHEGAAIPIIFLHVIACNQWLQRISQDYTLKIIAGRSPRSTKNYSELQKTQDQDWLSKIKSKTKTELQLLLLRSLATFE